MGRVHRAQFRTAYVAHPTESELSLIFSEYFQTMPSSHSTLRVDHNWFMQFWKSRQPQTTLNSWGFSGMEFGPCSALGAKLAAPDRTVISVCGDGGFIMVPHVLCTAVEYESRSIWIVWNNFAWGAIRDIQYGVFGGREIGTAFYAGSNGEPYNPDFTAMAKSCGVSAVTVTRSEDFAGAVEEAIKARLALFD